MSVQIPYWGNQDYQHMIKQVLSVGVMGIIVPEVETKAQAFKLVQTLRYASQRGRQRRRREGQGALGHVLGDAHLAFSLCLYLLYAALRMFLSP
jgi:2-keto-3-deoxy-L-rhamnonate aldolase RhmA